MPKNSPSQYTFRLSKARQGESVYVWWPWGSHLYDGAHYITWNLPSGWTQEYPARFNHNQLYAYNRARKINIPVNATPGNYSFPAVQMNPDGSASSTEISGAPSLDITVSPSLNSLGRPWVKCFGDPDTINELLLNGCNVVIQPGYYEWEKAIRLHPNCQLRMYGVHVCRKYDASAYQSAIFVPYDASINNVNGADHDMYLEGGTFWFDERATQFGDWGPLCHSWPRQTGVNAACTTFRNMKLIRCGLAKMQEANVLIENVEFHDGGTDVLPTNFVMRFCKFYGCTLPSFHAFLSWGAEGALIASCNWDSTSRGMIFQAGAGQGVLSLDTHLVNQRSQENNAGETILYEANEEWQDCAHYDHFVSNCVGPGIYISGANTHDMLFDSIDLHCAATAVGAFAFHTSTPGYAAKIYNIQFNNIESTSRWVFSAHEGARIYDFEYVNVNWAPGQGPSLRGNDTGAYIYNALDWRNKDLFPISATGISDEDAATHVFKDVGVKTYDNFFRIVKSINPFEIDTADDTPTLIDSLTLNGHLSQLYDSKQHANIAVFDIEVMGIVLGEDLSRFVHLKKRVYVKLEPTTFTVTVLRNEDTGSYRHNDLATCDLQFTGYVDNMNSKSMLGCYVVGIDTINMRWATVTCTHRRVPRLNFAGVLES